MTFPNRSVHRVQMFPLAAFLAAGLLVPSLARGQQPGFEVDPGFGDIFDVPLDPQAEPPSEEPPIEPRNQLEERYMQWLINLPELVPLYTEGVQLLQQEQYEEAAERFAEVLAIDSTYIPALFEQARAYRELGDYEQAEQLLLRAYNYDQSRAPSIPLELGRVSIELENYADAQAYLQQADLVSPSNPEISQLLGAARYRQGLQTTSGRGSQQLFQAARTALNRALRLQPDFAEAIFERGRVLTELGRTGDLTTMDAAIVDLERAVELQPDLEQGQGWGHLGVAYSMRANREANLHGGDTEAVIAHLQKAIDAYDRFIELRGPAEEQAKSQTNSLLEEDPKVDELTLVTGLLSRARARIALARERKDQQSEQLYRTAIDDLEQVLTTERANMQAMDAHLQMGIAFRMLGDHQRAIDAHTHCLAVSRNSHPEAFLRRGVSFYHLGRTGMAAVDFRRAHQLQYSAVPDPKPSFWLGLIALQQDNLPEAARLLTEALRHSNDNYPLAAMNRGICFLRLGNYDRAIRDFDMVLTQDASNERARRLRDRAQQLLAAGR